MIKLKPSGVLFNHEEHRYFLNGKELHGITSILKKQLFKDKYKDIPQFVLDKAAERGTMIHENIELYDAGFEPAVSSPELNNYKLIKNAHELITIANEYIVTDGSNFASGIDLVLGDKEDNIILADIKTTSVLDKEYTQWQLSIYAYLFELQNPKLKVSQIYALWLRDEKHEFAELNRIDTAIVKDLLQCEIESRQFVNPVMKTDANVPAGIKNAEMAVYTLITQIKKLDAKKKQLSEGLLKLMQENDVKSYKGEFITLSRKAASTREDIDKKKLKEEYPEIYAACVKTTKINETLQIR
ncbi:PD-(D/E)XK nuclease family protein [Prevotella koreensis]